MATSVAVVGSISGSQWSPVEMKGGTMAKKKKDEKNAKQKTRYPGIWRLGPRRYEIRFRVKDQRSTKLKEVRRVREGVTIMEALDLQRTWRQEARKAGELGVEQRLTVAQYAASWMRSKAHSLRIAPARRYAHALDAYVLPSLGHYYVNGLNPMIIRDWLASLTELTNPRSNKPYSPESLNGHFRVLRAMLRDAAADFNLPDPTRRVKVLDNHNKGERKKRTLTAKQLAAFLDEVMHSEARHYPMTVVAFLTGMRFGEYSALRWEDILEDEGIILLRRSHYRGHLALPKNKEPRVVPLDEQGMIIGALREHRAWLLKLQTRKGLESGYVRGFSEGWVFPSRKGSLSCSSMLDKPWARVAEKIKLGHPVTSHDARRTFNTLARQASVPDRVIQAIIGHHSDDMTERYDRVEVGERREAVGKVIQFANLVPHPQVGDQVGGGGPERENASSAGCANEAFSKAKIRAGDEI